MKDHLEEIDTSKMKVAGPVLLCLFIAIIEMCNTRHLAPAKAELEKHSSHGPATFIFGVSIYSNGPYISVLIHQAELQII